MVFLGEVVAQQANRSEVDLATLYQRKHDRKPASDACRRQSIKRLTFAQSELSYTVVEQRWATILRVKLSLVDLRNVRDDPRFRAVATRQ
jgi:hypothetical protein